MTSLTLRPVARAEIEEAYDWYKERREDLGEKFLAEVTKTLNSVEESPLRHPLIRGDVRRALLHRFPYSILYVVDREATVVLACFHASRNPRSWHTRRSDF